MKIKSWLVDKFNKYEKRSYAIIETLFKYKSKYQNIEILKLGNQGITLVLDGKVRVFEIDEYIYHESITYPALNRHSKPFSILVIGDGDGGIIRELLKSTEIKIIDWVEIDLNVVKACEQFLPTFPKQFRNDNRVNLIIKDGYDYLLNCFQQYDIIYISVTAQGNNNYSELMYSEKVYNLIKKILKSNGILVTSLNEFTPYSIYDYKNKIKVLQKLFNFVKPFFVPLPSFGSFYGFALSSDSKLKMINCEKNNELKFYNKEQDNYLFYLPKYLL
jgi:spermidine synthase